MLNVVHLESRMFQTSKIVRTVLELKAFMFKSLYIWMGAGNNSCFFNFSEFSGFVFFLSLIGGFSCILCVLGLFRFVLSNEIDLL